MKHNCKMAFTLAEVLITLAVIGIVAALTIPGLIQNYKKRIVETRLQRFYSLINQAINLSVAEHGEISLWDDLGSGCEFVEDEAENNSCVKGSEDALIWYNKYLAKYIKTVKVSTAQDKSYGDPNGKNPADVILYFLDGSALQFSSRGWNFYINAKEIKEDNRPENYGVNVFPFQFKPKSETAFFKNKGVVPYMEERTGGIDLDFLTGDNSRACSEKGDGAFCTELIRRNGWKIPTDYPYKF